MINRLICTPEVIISSSYDTTVRCWLLDPVVDPNESHEACVRVFRGHHKSVYPIIFVPAEEDDGDNEPDVTHSRPISENYCNCGISRTVIGQKIENNQAEPDQSHRARNSAFSIDF